MFKQIRSMLQESGDPLGGPESAGVEMDEAYFGARRKRLLANLPKRIQLPLQSALRCSANVSQLHGAD